MTHRIKGAKDTEAENRIIGGYIKHKRRREVAKKRKRKQTKKARAASLRNLKKARAARR